MTLPELTITFPARDRAWVLPHTLKALEAQTYPAEKLAFRFIAHNCTDSTYELLQEWCATHDLLYRYCQVERVTDDTPMDGRTSRERDRSARDPRHAQGRLKNKLKSGLDRREWWGFLDSDVLLHPDAFRLMAQARKDIVGGLTNVTPADYAGECLWNYFPANPRPGMPFRRIPGSPVPASLERVGLVAGILLYSPLAVRHCSFDFIGVGEDEGAIRDAEQFNLGVYLEPRARGVHVMAREHLEAAVKEWEAWQR